MTVYDHVQCFNSIERENWAGFHRAVRGTIQAHPYASLVVADFTGSCMPRCGGTKAGHYGAPHPIDPYSFFAGGFIGGVSGGTVVLTVTLMPDACFGPLNFHATSAHPTIKIANTALTTARERSRLGFAEAAAVFSGSSSIPFSGRAFVGAVAQRFRGWS